MKKFYFKLDNDIIIDVIEYPHDTYIEVELSETHLPAGINAGYYRLNGTVYSVDEDLKTIAENKQTNYNIISVCIQEEIIETVKVLVSEAVYDSYGNEITPAFYKTEQVVISPAIYEDRIIDIDENQSDIE
jgi:hypothetical protein